MYIDKKEVLRYLGISISNIIHRHDDYIQDCIDEILKIANPKHIYKFYDISHECDYISINDTNMKLKGKSIAKHLNNCTRCVLLGITLGISIDKRIEYYKTHDLTRSLTLDACATALIENICNHIQEEIRKIAKENYGCNITSRYSSGYGDLPLSLQSTMLRVLQADKIGLTVTEQFIMIPRKSITAIIGLSNNNYSEKGCMSCDRYEDCRYRKE
ncbi:hypothetical protein DW1_2610 [Proteiniborus sp. DW1]|uniref:vitamin B12 dependent-methionine synthase activation domain-containing protein n=1 Tax=Proteiniborus sp. DW1 TaxID=1889883 RepID=UPI00092E1C29|nr:vitamin B12 dependent-methionine synthase activation domain-containing protein [Proteiniborus sp. DW1]SCG84171.1 hypothetical protein DW1_2610 [Proteiniborus sp. DW1]